MLQTAICIGLCEMDRASHCRIPGRESLVYIAHNIPMFVIRMSSLLAYLTSPRYIPTKKFSMTRDNPCKPDFKEVELEIYWVVTPCSDVLGYQPFRRTTLPPSSCLVPRFPIMTLNRVLSYPSYLPIGSDGTVPTLILPDLYPYPLGSPNSFILKMEAAKFYETLVSLRHYYTVSQPKDHELYLHRHENFRSRVSELFSRHFCGT